MNGKTIFISILVVSLTAFGLSLYNKTTKLKPQPTIPQVVEPIEEVETSKAFIPDLIEVTTPLNNQKISNTILVQGRARGFWFFEASFPYKVLDANDQLLSMGAIMTIDEWMTEDFVNFSKLIVLDKTPETKTGKVILMKDNPSGDPQYDKQLVIPVIFE